MEESPLKQEEKDITHLRINKEDKDYFVNNDDLQLYLMLKWKMTCRTQQQFFHLLRLETEDNFKKNLEVIDTGEVLKEHRGE